MENRDIKIIPESYVGKVDFEVIDRIEKNKNSFDTSYLKFIEKYHGTIPVIGKFKSEKGTEYKIGRFLTLVDANSQLSSPAIQSHFNNRDARIDWSIYTLIDEQSQTQECFIDGEKNNSVCLPIFRFAPS